MDERAPEEPSRVALLSPKAASDLSANPTYTAQLWDLEQAERYTEFLKFSDIETGRRPAAWQPRGGPSWHLRTGV
jgi:hypothetical protein